MKIDTNNVSEIIIYGLNYESMVDLADLPDNMLELYRTRPNECINTEDLCGFPEQWRIAREFFERVESLVPTELWKGIALEDRFETNYIAYTCYLDTHKMEVTTSQDVKTIPTPIVDRLVGYALLYGLQVEVK